MPTTVLLVRHGQTEWNRIERFRGRADVPLNETGLRQAEATGRRLAEQWRPVAIYSSPLGRAVQTAEAIGRFTGLTVQTHPDLTDIDYGEWQGLTPDEARQRWAREVDDWRQRPHLAIIPGGETLAEVRMRCRIALKNLTSRHNGQTFVLVGHTVTNRLILLDVLGLGNDHFWCICQEPCAVNVFEEEAGEYTLVSMNDVCHLNSIS